MRKLGPPSFPPDHPNDYSRRLSVMLYQYLRDIATQINALIESASSGGGGGGSTVVSGSLLATVPGPAGRFEHEETIVAVGVTTSMKVVLCLAPHADSDENNEQALSVVGMAGEAEADAITVRMAFSSLTSGPIRINYMAV